MALRKNRYYSNDDLRLHGDVAATFREARDLKDGSLNADLLQVSFRVVNADLSNTYKENDEFQFWSAPTSTTKASDSNICSMFGGHGPKTKLSITWDEPPKVLALAMQALEESKEEVRLLRAEVRTSILSQFGLEEETRSLRRELDENNHRLNSLHSQFQEANRRREEEIKSSRIEVRDSRHHLGIRMDKIANLQKKQSLADEMLRDRDVQLTNKFLRHRKEIMYQVDLLVDDLNSQCNHLSSQVSQIQSELNSQAGMEKSCDVEVFSNDECPVEDTSLPVSDMKEVKFRLQLLAEDGDESDKGLNAK